MHIFLYVLLALIVIGALFTGIVFQKHDISRADGATCNGVNGISYNNGAYSFSPLHVASNGTLEDSLNCPVRLHGANWAGTDYTDATGGNGGPSLASFKWFHDNENINLWRIWVNASWWLNNYPVPLEHNMPYQQWIEQIVSNANQSGAYVLLVKGAQWSGVWDSTKNAYDGIGPCGGTSGIKCGHQDTANSNCLMNVSLCWQRSTGLTIGYTDPKIKLTCTRSNAASCDTLPTALSFWQSATQVFSSNPSVFYDSWNELHEIDCSNWKTDNIALIPTIRSGAPNSLVFLGGHNYGISLDCLIGANPGGGQQSDLNYPNLVYDFHVYPGSVGTCTAKASPTSPMWTQYPGYDNQVLAYLSSGTNPNGPTGYGGHGFSISEWGGSNQPPCPITQRSYDTDMTGLVKNNYGVMMYFNQHNIASYKNGSYSPTGAGTIVTTDYSSW